VLVSNQGSRAGHFIKHHPKNDELTRISGVSSLFLGASSEDMVFGETSFSTTAGCPFFSETDVLTRIHFCGVFPFRIFSYLVNHNMKFHS